MGFLDKVKAGAEAAATKAKEEAKELKLKRDLGNAYEELGKAAFDAVSSGAVAHASFDSQVAKIKDLQAQLAALAAPETSTGAEGSSS
jgi:hypothetical protein